MTYLPNYDFQIADEASLAFENTTIDGKQFNALVKRYQVCLANLGVRSGHRIIIYGGKSIEQAALIFAILNVDAVLIPLFPGLKGTQIAHIIQDSEANCLITTSRTTQELTDVAAETGLLCLSIEVLETLPHSNQLVGASTTPSVASALIYTSGSTGLPKGICLSRENLWLSAMSVATYMKLDKRDRVLCLLPLSFDAGLNQLLAAALAGASVVLCDFIHPTWLERTCQRHGITVITGVPGLWTKLTQHKWRQGKTHLRLIANTGGHLHLPLIDGLTSTFPEAGLMPMYGFTEAFRCSFLPPEMLGYKPSSVGKPIPFAHFAIVNDRGEVCGPGEVGELIQFGPLVAHGYWNRSKQSAAKFPSNPPAVIGRLIEEMRDSTKSAQTQPWRCVRSGDLMKTDEDGDLYFVSRADEMIKANGFRISPHEIEQACLKVGLKAAVAVSQSTIAGDLIGVACQVPEGSEHTADDLKRQLQSMLPSYMAPSVVVVRRDWPVTANGKLDRANIKRHLFPENGVA